MNYDDDEHDDDDCFADTQEVSFSLVSEKQHMMRMNLQSAASKHKKIALLLAYRSDGS